MDRMRAHECEGSFGCYHCGENTNLQFAPADHSCNCECHDEFRVVDQWPSDAPMAPPMVRPGQNPNFEDWWVRQCWLTTLRTTEPPALASVGEMGRLGLQWLYCALCGQQEDIEWCEDLEDQDNENLVLGGFAACRLCSTEWRML